MRMSRPCSCRTFLVCDSPAALPMTVRKPTIRPLMRNCQFWGSKYDYRSWRDQGGFRYIGKSWTRQGNLVQVEAGGEGDSVLGVFDADCAVAALVEVDVALAHRSYRELFLRPHHQRQPRRAHQPTHPHVSTIYQYPANDTAKPPSNIQVSQLWSVASLSHWGGASEGLKSEIMNVRKEALMICPKFQISDIFGLFSRFRMRLKASSFHRYFPRIVTYFREEKSSQKMVSQN